MTVITYILFVLGAIYSNPCECLKCYQCSGQLPCGQGHMDLMMDCPGKCMVYRNEVDSKECGEKSRKEKIVWFRYNCSSMLCVELWTIEWCECLSRSVDVYLFDGSM